MSFLSEVRAKEIKHKKICRSQHRRASCFYWKVYDKRALLRISLGRWARSFWFDTSAVECGGMFGDG